MSIGLVLAGRLVQRGLCSKSWYPHVYSPDNWFTISAFVERSQLGNKERKLLGYITTHSKLFCKVGSAIGKRKDDINDFAGAPGIVDLLRT